MGIVRLDLWEHLNWVHQLNICRLILHIPRGKISTVSVLVPNRVRNDNTSSLLGVRSKIERPRRVKTTLMHTPASYQDAYLIPYCCYT